MAQISAHPQLKRRSIGLSDNDFESLALISKLYGSSTNEAIRKAIAIASHLIQATEQNGKILIQNADGSIHELVFLP
jgi:spermidine/putrescine-binding protein